MKTSHESLTGLFTRPFRDDAWQVIGLISLACLLMMGLPLTFMKARILYPTSNCKIQSGPSKVSDIMAPIVATFWAPLVASCLSPGKEGSTLWEENRGSMKYS